MSLLETQHYFYPGITGREYLGLFPTPRAFFNAALWEELFNLPLDELIENYSTGMKTKLALTGIIKLDKTVMLLDEPFNGTDLETGRIIKLLLAKLKEKGKTVIVTSHILETLTGSCDYIHHLAGKGIRKTYSRDSWVNMERDLFAAMEEKVRVQIDKAF
jgi:ABC-2 type transport system ATP-binding protein